MRKFSGMAMSQVNCSKKQRDVDERNSLGKAMIWGWEYGVTGLVYQNIPRLFTNCTCLQCKCVNNNTLIILPVAIN
jgi:hypothetical protein